MAEYTLAELKKKYEKMSKKKGYRGWHEATKQNAGNVPLNNAIFNMMMGSAKSVDMAQVNADGFVGDGPSTSAAPAAATPDGGVGMVGMAEDINNEPLTLRVDLDDGDYMVTQYEGTLRGAKDHFIGKSLKWEGDPDQKTGVGVKLMPTNSHAARFHEDIDRDREFMIINAVRHIGQDLPNLSADDWIALRDDPALDHSKKDLWMYGNEVRALMDFVFDLKDPYDIIHERGGAMGVTVNKVLKDLAKKDEEDRKKAYQELDDRLKKAIPSFDDLDEGFGGDVHKLIDKLNTLEDDEVLRLTNQSANPDLCIKKNSKFPGRFILWNETKNGEVTDRVNFSSLANAVEWAKKTDSFLFESKKETK